MSARRTTTTTTTPSGARQHRLQEVLSAGQARAAATDATVTTAAEAIAHKEQVEDYIFQNITCFKTENNYVNPGDRVMEQDSGRVGTVEEGGRDWSVAFHPAVRYDDEPDYVSTEYNTGHFKVIVNEDALPPFPWAATQ